MGQNIFFTFWILHHTPWGMSGTLASLKLLCVSLKGHVVAGSYSEFLTDRAFGLCPATHTEEPNSSQHAELVDE